MRHEAYVIVEAVFVRVHDGWTPEGFVTREIAAVQKRKKGNMMLFNLET